MECLSGVICCRISDHNIIFLTFPISTRSNSYLKSFRDHSNRCVEKFKIEFSDLFETIAQKNYPNLDEKVSDFSINLYDRYNRSCPIRTKNVTDVNARKPWLTKEIVKLLKFKQFLYRDYKNNYLPYHIFNNFKNKLTNIIKIAKKNCLKQKFRDCIGNSRKTWQNINSLYRNNVKSNNIFLNENGSCITAEKDVANVFNDYFATVAHNLDNNIPVSNQSPSSYLSGGMSNIFSAPPTNESEVQNIIESLPIKSSPLDEVPVFIYKKIVSPLSKCISSFFNESILHGVYPQVLKISRIVPLFKSGDNTSKLNFRPISVINFIAKLFEKLMYSRLFKFVSENNILCKHQFGFRSGLCTSDAIVEYLDQVYKAINNNKIFVTIFLDFSRAFDTVNIDILLMKLEYYGIRGISNHWFASYLTNRPRCVSIKGVKSSYIECNIGVPQGSVLGPMLFIIYINDMYNACKNLQLIHYADDTTAFVSGSDSNELMNIINFDLESLSRWLQCNRLTLNISKSLYMIHGNFDRSFSYNICIRNESLKLVNNAKFLGIIIDDKLKFENHVYDVIAKLSKVSGIIWKSKEVLPKETLRMLYLSLGWSQLSYGVLAWGRCSLTFINKIRVAQNRIVRNIYGSANFDVYKSNNLLPFNETYDLYALLKLFKEIKMPNQSNSYFIERVQELQTNHNYNTRFISNNNLVTPRIIKSKCYSSFLYKSTHLWNSLPPEIKNISDIASFKNKLRIFLLNR